MKLVLHMNHHYGLMLMNNDYLPLPKIKNSYLKKFIRKIPLKCRTRPV